MTSRNETKQATAGTQGRRQYTTPKLVVYGDVRQLTQGGTAGEFEGMNNDINFMN